MNSDKTAGLLAAHLFLARDMAHRAHLRTSGRGSFADHSALGTFYEELIDKADEFVECYQGEYETLLDIPLMDNEYEGEIRDVLKQIKAWIQDNRDATTDDTSLLNLIDDIVKLFQRTNFKLQYLE
jgi:DNA-binding ferritin-like protein